MSRRPTHRAQRVLGGEDRPRLCGDLIHELRDADVTLHILVSVRQV